MVDFFDPATAQIDRLKLNVEIDRLGLHFTTPAIIIDRESPRTLIPNGDIDLLLKKYQKTLETGVFNALPQVITSATQAFIRNPLVIQISQIRANSKCEIPGCSVHSFITESGTNFCEIHHVTPLSEGGEDLIENTICLCPVHHREAHHGKEKMALRKVMLKVRAAT